MVQRYGACAGLAMAAGIAAADTVVVTSDRDNTMWASADGSVSNGAGEHMWTGRNAFGSTRRALVHFTLAGVVPPGSVVTDVKLTLYMSMTVSFDHDAALHRALKDWGEGASNSGTPGGQGAPSAPGDATWVHTFYATQFWGTPGGDSGGPSPDFVATASAVATIGNPIQSYNWNATPLLLADAQGWLDAPATNFGWFVIGDESATGTAKRFETHESLTPEFRPRLTVTYTPPGPACYPNCDASTALPCLNIADFGCFLNRFAAGDTYANCDASTTIPVLNVQDFGCFLNAFAAGCSAC